MKNLWLLAVLICTTFALSAEASKTLITCETTNLRHEVELKVELYRNRNRLRGIVSKEVTHQNKEIVASVGGLNYGLCGANQCFTHKRTSLRLVLNEGMRSGILSLNTPRTGQLVNEIVLCSLL